MKVKNINSKIDKVDSLKILLWFFVIILLILGNFATVQKNALKLDLEGLVKLESMSSGIQRIAKLELEDEQDEELTEELTDIVNDLYLHSEKYIYFANDIDIHTAINDFVEDTGLFDDAVKKYDVDKNRNDLFFASERNYAKAETVILLATEYIERETADFNRMQMAIWFVLICIAITFVKILLGVVEELNKNKELSKEMFIDSATSLYNRSKCQEILKKPINDNMEKHRAIVIFDLNDLKKTNDNLGHRAGDDLISSFASQLKEATKIFDYEIFVGRYGGDEFMIYFDATEESDVQLYLQEVSFLLYKFNEAGNYEFELSCAAGYSITTSTTHDMKMRELFENADSDMYKNKVAMKEKKKQDLLKNSGKTEGK